MESGWEMKPAKGIRYRSPLIQVVILGFVCFCCPGMFNALNGLGAAGKADATITDNANTALSVTFAVCSLLAGGVFNWIGHRFTLLLGGLTYVLYVGSYLSYNKIFVITAGAVLGVGAGFLWASQGAIMMSYPEEKDKGKYIGIFWGIFNMGACLGSLIPLLIEFHNGTTHVSYITYAAFMTVMFIGAALSLLLLLPNQVIRDDGTPVTPYKYSNWKTEAIGIPKLFLDWRMVTLIPMFICSNWFYTYQFNMNSSGKFTTRTRAFNGTFYWAAQILGSNVMGNLLDSKLMLRRQRAWLGLGILGAAVLAVWGGGFAFQLTFTRQSARTDPPIDLSHSRSYAGPIVLYACYGLFDAMWQTFAYWLMGALTNDTREAARFSGFYKAIQNCGNALAAQVDAKKVSFLWQLGINWVLVGLGVIFAIPVVMSVKNTLVHEGESGGGDENNQPATTQLDSAEVTNNSQTMAFG